MRRRVTIVFTDVPDSFTKRSEGWVATVPNSDLSGYGITIPLAFKCLIDRIHDAASEKALRAAGEQVEE